MTSFIFKSYEVDLKRGKAAFHYAVTNNGRKYDFTETISFPPVSVKIPNNLLRAIFNNLLIILGISYWKLYCPKNIELPTISLTKEQTDFWNTVYTKGLGEFFYKNKLDFRGLVRFPHAKKQKNSPHYDNTYHYSDRSLLLVGGGKDSIVSAELLKKDKKQFATFIVNSSPIQKEVATIIGRESIIIEREIDAKLLELNKQKDTYNGHIPVSAIYAFLSVFAATVYDYRYIIVSNERSANYGNVKYLGLMINHQWSKSFEFEKLFQNFIAALLTPDIQYYSLLRTMTELEITEQFVKYPKYFLAFSSCNRNFTISKRSVDGKWCGKCPKCAFVFTCLAAYLPKEKVVRIFGKNLLEDKSLVTVFKQLLGVEDIKPFECVGTPQEMKQAMHLIKKKSEFDGDIVMKALDLL